jgi:HD domain
VVALLDETETALTLVAAASLRPLAAEPAIGTRVPLPLVPWVHPVLETRQPAVFPTASLEGSPLVPAESTVILVVPIASTDRVHGVVILGEQRNPKFAPFAPAKIAQSVGEARHIATVIEALRQLDASAHHRREELHQARMEMARTLLGSVKEHLRSRRSRRGESGRERSRRMPPLPAELAPMTRLTLDLAARLGLEPSQREPLRQAIEALDIGRAWLEELLFPRAGFSEEEAAALLETQAEHSAALLEALDWPARALALVRAHGAWWDGAGHPPGLAGSSIPPGARILSVMSAYARAMGSNADGAAPAPSDVIASLRREAGTRFDPGVVDTLAALVIPSTE